MNWRNKNDQSTNYNFNNKEDQTLKEIWKVKIIAVTNFDAEQCQKSKVF